MPYLSFINSLLRGIGDLFIGVNRLFQSILNGASPRLPEPAFVGNVSFDPRPITQISGVQFFFLVVSVFFLVIIIYLVQKHREHMREDAERMERYFIKPTVRHIQETRWSKVEQLFSSSNESDWRLGIIEADALLEDLTLQLGYPGMNLGERLKSVNPRNFPMLQQAWHVHILRNKIAHEGMRFHLSHHEAWRAFKIYETIFRGYGYTG